MIADNQDNEMKHNYLATAEMGEEGNYNMIDGIINNTPKPSVLEQLREYERLMAQNDDAVPGCAELEIRPSLDRWER